MTSGILPSKARSALSSPCPDDNMNISETSLISLLSDLMDLCCHEPTITETKPDDPYPTRFYTKYPTMQQPTMLATELS